MTTIASDGALLLVTDSSVSDDDQVWSIAKAERIHGAIYATAGGASDGEKFIAWVRRNRRGKKPVVDEGFSALALTKDGLFLFDKELYPMKLQNAHAIGSGGKAARALMIAGIPVTRAVEIVCEVDAGSRLPLQVYSLADAAEEKK